MSAAKEFVKVKVKHLIYSVSTLTLEGATNKTVETEEERCNKKECASNCEDPWEETNGRCYLWSREKMFLEPAEKNCRSLGSHLVSVTSQDEQNYLLTNVRLYEKLSFNWVLGKKFGGYNLDWSNRPRRRKELEVDRLLSMELHQLETRWIPA